MLPVRSVAAPEPTGRLDLVGLDAAEPHEIGHQRAQMLLAHQVARQHIAHVQGIGAVDGRVEARG